jgi:hypothetical protein
VRALLQHLDIQFAQQRFGGGCAFEQEAVTCDDTGGMFDQYFGKLGYTWVSHRGSPIVME